VRVPAIGLALAVFLVYPSLALSGPPSANPDDRNGFEDRHPEGLFVSIVTAHGQELVMGKTRSYEIVSVKPTDTFTADVPEIFVVFQVLPHLSNYQVWGRWVVEKGEGIAPDTVLGQDVMLLALEDDFGYLSLKRPGSGWPKGEHRVEIHVGFKISDISKVGTLRFKVLPAKTSS
jgi:hypothetical protein